MNYMLGTIVEYLRQVNSYDLIYECLYLGNASHLELSALADVQGGVWRESSYMDLVLVLIGLST